MTKKTTETTTKPATTGSTSSTSSSIPDTFSYQGWLNSDNFLKRSFAIFGYYTVANLIIGVALMAVFAILLFFAAIMGMLIF